jgi:hypothetical protein
MPKSRPKKRKAPAVVEVEFVPGINRRGNPYWLERPVTPSAASGSSSPQRTPRRTAMPSDRREAGGPNDSYGEEWGSSHEHYLGRGAPRKTKVGRFAG